MNLLIDGDINAKHIRKVHSTVTFQSRLEAPPFSAGSWLAY